MCFRNEVRLSAKHLPCVDQEDTVLSGVTLNFVDCVSIFVSSVKKFQQRPVYDRMSFSNAFSSTSWSGILRK